MARKRAKADAVASDERADKARRPASPVPPGAGGGLRRTALASLERAPPFRRSAALSCSPGAARATAPEGRMGSPMSKASTASRRLASGAVAQATRPTGVFQQPVNEFSRFSASRKRASAEFRKPANSPASGGSPRRDLPGPLRASRGEVIFPPEDPKLGLCQDPFREGISLPIGAISLPIPAGPVRMAAIPLPSSRQKGRRMVASAIPALFAQRSCRED